MVNLIHSLFYIRFAALRSVSLRLQSLNQKTLTEYRIYYGVFSRICFFDFFFDLYFDFRLIVPWQDKRDFRRILWEENCESMDGSCGLPAVSLWDNVSAPMLHLWWKGAALLVQGCCTFTGTIIRKSLQWLFCHIAMIYCQYTYAVLSVYLCCTIGIAMLYLWYQDALLLWYRFFNLFTGNIKVNLVTKCSKIHPWGCEGGVRVESLPSHLPSPLKPR